MEDDYNYMDSSGELHVFKSQRGEIPRQLGSLYGKNIRRANFSSCQIRSSKNLSMFPFLEELVLDNNELQVLEMCRLPRLHTLSLNNNKLEDLDAVLVALQRCAGRLRYLSLLGNPCSPDQLTTDHHTADDYARHRLYVLHMLPQLQFLDSRGVSRAERVEAKRRGRYCRTARLVKWDDASSPSRTEWGEDVLDSALSPPLAAEQRRRGPVFGHLTHRYIGKHSEGNRFISNSDL